MAYLGLDLGTSGLRAVLMSSHGDVCAVAERSCRVSHPHSGWSEQDPQDWITALEDAIAELKTAAEFSNLRGIGVAGHMHGATLLDSSDRVLRPCILWNDTRAHAEAASLDQQDRIRALSGNIVFPGFTAPKLLWVEKHEPDIFKNIAKVLLPAAYLNLYLSGKHVADMSDSAGTAWLDVGARDWSEHLLAQSHMRRDQMPELVEGSAPAGTLRQALMDRWGLTHPVTIAGGAGDNAAAACGIGVLNEGQGFLSLGTSGVLLAARGGYHPAPDTAVHTFCHAIPERWYQMGVMLSATDSLNWLSEITGCKPAALTAELGEALSPPGSLRFLPYLSGERTPHNDATIRGGFTGIDRATSRADMTRAVLEGVAFALRDNLEALKTSGAQMRQLTAIGGGTASRYWLKLLATVLGLPLQRPKGGEFGAALGAARLSLCAETGADPLQIMTAPEIGETIFPEDHLIPAFETAYQAYRATYPAIKSIQ